MMNEIILVINAGSSSIKFSLFHFERLKLISYGEIDDIFESSTFSSYNDKKELIIRKKLNSNGYEFGLKYFFNWFETNNDKSRLKIVGHRIVHGGTDFFEPVRINAEIINKLTKLIPLAPLHQTHNIEAIKVIAGIYPDIVQVGCFDTAFHRTQSKLATLFAIPRKLTEKGLIRYGFHGLSYEYIASVLPEYLGKKAQDKIIVAHLGNGASMCAMHLQKSVATTMGFTALDGLMMGTRCGSIDPGVLLYLLQNKKYTSEELEKLLYEQSGLLGVSNISNDVRELEQSNTLEAREALDLFCFKAARELSTLVTVLRGCDAIVFTAGIGENSAVIRQGICKWLDWLGVQLDDEANSNNKFIISDQNSKVLVAIIPTKEEYMIAKHTKTLTDNKHSS